MTESKLLTAKDLGQLLALSKRQIFRLNSCGKIPNPLKVGGSIRWRQTDINLWLEMGCPPQNEFQFKKLQKTKDKDI